ncbi:hypothetical protein DL89DRAFT_295679 [Linderina pennispora]|uniref:DUF3533 domain-containing protein n=1 Tax=Linderina pennispora TaxID=61395 RepID=A0A1Y1VY19_9FUNG|nr:uncharacterized protein DL89DRAFT_295679 [Linderina pennispora]ORX66182.1 hypothetical protein DL89DRAFT_295679 [Linderina pennispora]
MHNPELDAERINIWNKSLYGAIRNHFFKNLRLLAILTVFMWSLLSITLGSNHKRGELGYLLNIELVNLDDGNIGHGLTEAIMQMPRGHTSPTWREYVKKDGYGAVVINPGLSSRLNNALLTGAAYNASEAMTLVVQSAHYPLGQLMFVQFTTMEVAARTGAMFAVELLQQFKQSSDDEAKAKANPQALLNPIGFTVDNVASYAFDLAPVMSPLTLLFCFVGVMASMVFLKFGTYITYQKARQRDIFLGKVLALTILCLLYTFQGALAYVAYKGPEYNSAHKAHKVTPEFIALPSIFTVIPNLCSGIQVPELCPTFFKWFKGLPYYHGSMLSRYIMSGAHERIGMNLGVLFGLAVFSLILLFFSTMWQEHRISIGQVDSMGWQGAEEKKTIDLEQSVESVPTTIDNRHPRFESSQEPLRGRSMAQRALSDEYEITEVSMANAAGAAM